MGRQGEIENVLQIGQADAQGFPILLSHLDKRGQFFQLLAADGGLRIERL